MKKLSPLLKKGLPELSPLKTTLALFVICLVCTLSAGPKPPLPENFIARPKFINQNWNFEAGTAFYLKINPQDNKAYIVTAHHLFGPMGGLATDFHPGQLPEIVTAIHMTGIKSRKLRKFKVKPMAVPQDAQLKSSNPFYNRHVDLAVFKTDSRQGINWGTLSRDTLKTGDIIWQAGEPWHGQKKAELLHSCRIIKMTKGLGYCLFENQNLILNGTSGSPYVNSRGEVLGLHSGSLKEPGNLTGIILLAEIIRPVLK